MKRVLSVLLAVITVISSFSLVTNILAAKKTDVNVEWLNADMKKINSKNYTYNGKSQKPTIKSFRVYNTKTNKTIDSKFYVLKYNTNFSRAVGKYTIEIVLNKTGWSKYQFLNSKKQGTTTKTMTYSIVPPKTTTQPNKRGYISIRQNDPKYSNIKYGTSTIGKGGCGVCSSLMIIDNLTNYNPSLVTLKTEFEQVGARLSNGTAMYKAAQHLKKKYGLNYIHTTDINVVKQQLKKGNMVIANVGAKHLFTNGPGRFVVISGIYKDSKNKEYAVVLDPSYSYSKYNDKYRKENGIKDISGVIIAPFNAIKADAETEYYYCFCK